MKRLLDIVASAVGLMVTLPFYPLIAMAIKLDSPGPVFYRQARVGLNGRPFTILKFRTMASGADQQKVISVKGDSRVTRVGRWLRRFDVDELPTLVSVLRGDMSIVGPRPEIPSYVQHYTPEQRRVLAVRPGMTDLATLRFRNEADLLADGLDLEKVYREQIMPKKLQLNLDYVDRQSLILDLRIILQTLWLIVRQSKG